MDLRTWLARCASMALLVTPHALAAESATCPNLSGSYLYPGVAELGSICVRQWEGRRDLPIPGPGGFFISGAFRHPLEIRQIGCDELTIHFHTNTEPFAETPAGEDFLHSTTLDLRPGSKRIVAWQDGALSWTQHFSPSGFRWPPWRTESMYLRLQKLANGSLSYALRHEGPRGKVLGTIECNLPPWREAP